MTIMRNIRISFFALLVAAAALPALAQDVLTIGSATTMSGGGPLALPVSIRDVSGTRLGSDTTRIQGVAIKVDITPASAVASASFTRDGIAAALTPLFERSVSATSGDTLSASYIVSFDESSQPLPLVLNAGPPGSRVATLNVTLAAGLNAGTRVTIAVDRERTLLSNESGLLTESSFNRGLALNDAEVLVDGHPTTTTLTTSPNPVTSGSPLTMTAQVTSAVPGAITGMVAFRDGSQLLERVPLSGGQAVLTRSNFAAGTHPLTATYEGSPTYRSATSNTVSQVVNLPPFGAPQGVVATALSSTSVQVTWAPVSGAYVYEILRASNGSSYSTRYWIYTSQNTTTYLDNVSANTAYLYVVRAHANAGGVSPNSAPDFANSTIFTNDPLTLGTTIRLVHLTQLRQAVNAFRLTAGLPAATFTDPSPAARSLVKAVHVTELRTALNQARVALGFAATSFTDPSVAAGSAIRGVHFQQLRDALK